MKTPDLPLYGVNCSRIDRQLSYDFFKFFFF